MNKKDQDKKERIKIKKAKERLKERERIKKASDVLWAREAAHKLKYPDKECVDCGRLFSKKGKNSGRYNSEYPKCNKCLGIFSRYKITYHDYMHMLLKQREVCAICKRKESIIDKETKLIKPFVVDHCHTSGKVRGLLCHSCNIGIGFLRDNDQSLWNAIVYLKRSGDIDEII